MKPKDLLVLRLRAHVVPSLQALGFRFAASTPAFRRSVGHAQQHIIFSLNRYNREDDAEFWTMWSVTSRAYQQWYGTEWGEATSWDLLADSADWNIPGWARGPAEPRFHLANTAADIEEMEEFCRSAEGAGMAFLEAVSTWEGAAEWLRKKRWAFARAADFLLMTDQRERAHAVLREGIRNYEVEQRPDTLNELPQLQRRLARYFASRDVSAT